MRCLFIFFTLSFPLVTQQLRAQGADTLVSIDSAHRVSLMAYRQKNGTLLLYPKPHAFTFLKYIPRTLAGAVRESTGKKSLKAWGLVAGTTGLLFWNDQRLVDGVQHASKGTDLNGGRVYKGTIGFSLGSTDINLYDLPGNFNTAIYSIGEGIPPFLIAAGLLTHGLIRKDNRALSTASQLVQGLIAVGITTQLLKRVGGREVPFQATQDRGVWRPFPSFSEFGKNKTRYDAFPSGHMATMMTTVTLLADNYPDKRWIRPLGYSLMTIVGASMLNNGVHWASDYPLAIGIGYVTAKVTVNMNRWINPPPQKKMPQ